MEFVVTLESNLEVLRTRQALVRYKKRSLIERFARRTMIHPGLRSHATTSIEVSCATTMD